MFVDLSRQRCFEVVLTICMSTCIMSCLGKFVNIDDNTVYDRLIKMPFTSGFDDNCRLRR